MDAITVDQFKEALPPNVRKSFNQALIDKINATLTDPDMYESYRDNLLGYARVLADGKFKVQQYVDAVKFVSHRIAGATQIDAYSITFPDKIARFASQGVANKDIASYVSAYAKSKLVTLMMEQALVPTWLMNQDLFQEALNTQAVLMRTANSEKVRSDAANSILTHLKRPEAAKVQLDISVKEDSAIAALRETTEQLVVQQRTMIQANLMNAQDVAQSRLVIDAEVLE